MRNFRLLLLAAVTLFIAFKTPPLRAADLSSPLLLVAEPGHKGPFAQTVLIVLPGGNGTHLGVILNRPARAAAPVYYGGQDLYGPQFALVRAQRAPTRGASEVMPGLHMVFVEDEVEKLSRAPGDARFFVGLVTWDGGELEREMRAGLWRAHAPDLGLVFDAHAGTLWSRLNSRLRGVLTLQP